MADINVERKRGAGIWPWIIGLIILALVLWWLFSRPTAANMEGVNAVDTTVAATDAGAVAPGGTMPGMPMDSMAMGAPGGTRQPIPVEQILAAPAQYDRQSVSGSAAVAEVVSDRGFWIEDQGRRLFVTMADPQANEQPISVSPGQTVHLTGTVHRGGARAEVPFTLEAKAQQVVAKEPVFLAAQYRDLSVTAP